MEGPHGDCVQLLALHRHPRNPSLCLRPLSLSSGSLGDVTFPCPGTKLDGNNWNNYWRSDYWNIQCKAERTLSCRSDQKHLSLVLTRRNPTLENLNFQKKQRQVLDAGFFLLQGQGRCHWTSTREAKTTRLSLTRAASSSLWQEAAVPGRSQRMVEPHIWPLEGAGKRRPNRGRRKQKGEFLEGFCLHGLKQSSEALPLPQELR